MVMGSRNCPYAPPSTVIGLLRDLRKRNLPPVMDSKYLHGHEMSRTIAARVCVTLHHLDFIDQESEPRKSLQDLVRSQTDAEYRSRLEKAIRLAYAHIFKTSDPSRHGQHEIIRAFAPFEPASQHARMTTLFLGLCQEADIPIQETLRLPVSATSGAKGNASGMSAKARQRSPRRTALQVAPALESDMLWGLIKELPGPQDTFPPKRQDSWLEAVRGVLRHIYDEYEEAERDAARTDVE